MEGRVVLLNGDRVAVRLSDSSYSVFSICSEVALEVGDSLLGPLSKLGTQVLLHCRTQQWIDVKVKLARTQVAARTKRYLNKPNPRFAP